MVLSDETIRITLSSSSIASEATLAAFNKVIRHAGGATFLHVHTEYGTKVLTIQHENDETGFQWCQRVNVQVYRGERGVWIRSIDEVAGTALNLAYRLPETFLQLVRYIARGQVLYCPITKSWEYKAKDGGCYEAAWVRRQISRLENVDKFKIIDEVHDADAKQKN